MILDTVRVTAETTVESQLSATVSEGISEQVRGSDHPDQPDDSGQGSPLVSPVGGTWYRRTPSSERQRRTQESASD
jgi:hypothetical protein